MEVKQQTAAKIGLFSAISIIIGSMVGISIFFKNGSIFENNGNNPCGILLSWILGFIIAAAIGFSFAEIVSSKNQNANAGLGGYCNNFINKKVGRFVEINHPMFYYTLYTVVMSVFGGEAIWNCFLVQNPGSINTNFAFIMLIGLGLAAFFIFLNFISLKVGSHFANATTIIKFIPLVAIGIFGIIGGCIGKGTNLFIPSESVVEGFDITGVLSSLPAVLFAFDSFLIVGNIAGNMKNPEKNVPLTIIISMVVAGAMYLFVTIGQICIGSGDAYQLFTNFFNDNPVASDVFSVLISIFILIAVLGCINSMSIGAARSMQAAIEENKLVGSKTYWRLGNGHHLLPGIIALCCTYLFWWTIILIPSTILNTDQIIDGVSNIVVTFFFGIYALVILFALINRKTKKVETKKVKGFTPFAIIAIIGCALIFCYSIFWQYGFINIIHANDYFNVWGLFLVNSVTLTYWQATLVFWSFSIAFFLLPFVNDFLILLTNKRYNQETLI